jgi:hypothetical protein
VLRIELATKPASSTTPGLGVGIRERRTTRLADWRNTRITPYRADVPLDFGPLVGQPAFEQARGVLMQLCGFSAEESLAALREAARRTGEAPEDLVAALRSTPSFAVRRFDLCT